MTKIVPTTVFETERILPEEKEIEIGQWYWHTYSSRVWDETLEDYKPITKRVLSCVTYIGSNFVKVKEVADSDSRSHRIHLNEFDEVCVRELNHQAIITNNIGRHQRKVSELLDEVKRITNALGVASHGELAAQSNTSSALAAASSVADINEHKNALVHAKDTLLPDLFKQIKSQHEMMAEWMKSELIPAEAQLAIMKGTTAAINDRIFTVELYAGLTESLVQIQEGTPAQNDAKIKLFQRQHFMDEECLLDYQAGGMDFKSIDSFDKWLLKSHNLNRILPHDRCIVSMRIRRGDKDYGYASSLSEFISFSDMNEVNKRTFLYIRNGQQVWRMITSIDFGSDLFPDQDNNDLFNNKDGLYINENLSNPETVILSEREVEETVKEDEEIRARHERELAVWRAWQQDNEEVQRAAGLYYDDSDSKDHKKWVRGIREVAKDIIRHEQGVFVVGSQAPELDGMSESDKAKVSEYLKLLQDLHTKYTIKAGQLIVDGHSIDLHFGPDRSHHHFNDRRNGTWVRVSPDDTVYYDDVMQKISGQSKQHNRVAVVLQGLLDRSPCLKPHPPYRLWTAEGFTQGIELIYDNSRTITDGDPLDFSAYRTQLNKSIKVGSVTIGQDRAWQKKMAEAEAAKRDARGRNSFDREYYRPYNNPGPGTMAKIAKIRKGIAYFEWFRTSNKATWVPASRPGYLKKHYKQIKETFSISIDELFNVSAYTPGDYRMFYNDPRTRRQYLRWAPFLLLAEDYHANPGMMAAEQKDLNYDEDDSDSDDDDGDDSESDEDDENDSEDP